MAGNQRANEPHSLRGPIDRPALIAIRDVFNAEEPLATAQLDDFLNPSALEIRLDDGLHEAEHARFDVQWTTRDDYKFHYTDPQEMNFRWGKHPHGGDYIRVNGLEHYYPPPDASSDPTTVEDSCITQSPRLLVTRAVLKLWRVAYHANSVSPLNAGRNPP